MASGNSVIACMGLLLGLSIGWAAPAQATTLYAMASNNVLWRLDTTGNAGDGAWTQFTMTGSALSGAHGIDVDAAGNVYVANWGTYGSAAISKLTISGTTATSAYFPVGISTNQPWDVAVAGSNLYISDGVNKRVVRTSLNGSGDGVVIGGVLASATRGIAFNGGSIFVDSGSSVYQITDAAGAAPGTAAEAATAPGGLGGLDTDGTHFFATYGAGLYSGTTSLTKIASLPNGYASGPALVYADDHIFVADNSGSGAKIFEYSTAGTLLKTYTQSGASAQFHGITVVPAPEPATLGLVSVGAAGLLLRRRK